MTWRGCSIGHMQHDVACLWNAQDAITKSLGMRCNEGKKWQTKATKTRQRPTAIQNGQGWGSAWGHWQRRRKREHPEGFESGKRQERYDEKATVVCKSCAVWCLNTSESQKKAAFGCQFWICSHVFDYEMRTNTHTVSLQYSNTLLGLGGIWCKSSVRRKGSWLSGAPSTLPHSCDMTWWSIEINWTEWTEWNHTEDMKTQKR